MNIRITNIRNYATNRHRTIDDIPYGGGNGMVIMTPPLIASIEDLPSEPPARIILLTPQGAQFCQNKAKELVKLPRLILICGRYEGIDERVRILKVDEEISLGDFILSGGELAALCIIETISRLIPGVLGTIESSINDSFMNGLLEYPQYTKPSQFRGLTVPNILLSGHHTAINQWKRKESLQNTLKKRPELLSKIILSPKDQQLIKEIYQKK